MKYVAIVALLVFFTAGTMAGAKELKGFGFEGSGKDAKFYKLQYDGEEKGGSLIIEDDIKFVAKGACGEGENSKKMSFELFDPDSNIDEELDKKGIKLKNVKVGSLELEPVPDFDNKFRGSLKLNKEISGIKGQLVVYLAIFDEPKEKK